MIVSVTHLRMCSVEKYEARNVCNRAEKRIVSKYMYIYAYVQFIFVLSFLIFQQAYSLSSLFSVSSLGPEPHTKITERTYEN
jgi:hypothetical protein